MFAGYYDMQNMPLCMQNTPECSEAYLPTLLLPVLPAEIATQIGAGRRSSQRRKHSAEDDTVHACPLRYMRLLMDGSARETRVDQGFVLPGQAQGRAYSTQSAIKMLVSCGCLPLRLDAHTSFLPSELNMGKASKSGWKVIRSWPLPSALMM